MSSPKRLIVDGVEFPQIVQFPKILGAVTSALQPSRLIIGLLMVVALITFGRVWDGLARSSVNPAGLEAGRWDAEADGRTLQMVLRSSLRPFTEARPLNEADNNTDLETGDVLREIAAGYREKRKAITDDLERQNFDRQYTATVASINEARPLGVFEASAMHAAQSVHQIVAGVLALNGGMVLSGAERLVVTLPSHLWNNHHWFLLLYGLLFMIVFSVGGGAISRMQAMQTAAQHRLRLGEAVDFALAGWFRFLTAQLWPLILTALLVLVLVVMAVLLLVPLLDVVGGLLYGLALCFGFLAAFLLIGYAVGSPLLVPAVACENGDGLDAMQRAYAYVVTRPLHLLFYWAVSLVGLALGFVLVSLFAMVMLNLTAEVFAWVSGHPALNVTGGFRMFDLSPSSDAVAGAWHERWTASGINFWQTVVVCLVAAYVFSFHFSAATVVYLLMRLASDGQDIEEVWQPGMIQGTTVAVQSQVAVTTVTTMPITSD